MRSFMEAEVIGIKYFVGEMTDDKTGEIRKINSGSLFVLGPLDATRNESGRSVKLGLDAQELRLVDSLHAQALEKDQRLAQRQPVPVRITTERVSDGKGGTREIVAAVEIIPAKQPPKAA